MSSLIDLCKINTFDNYIQTIAYTKNPKKVFLDGRMQDTSSIDRSLTYKSWQPFGDEELNCEYAMFYVNGDHFSNYLSEEDKSLFNALMEKRQAYLESFRISKLDVTRASLTDLMPESFLNKYFDLMNKATKQVFASFKRPENYQFLVDEYNLIDEISTRKMNLKFTSDAMSNPRYKKAYMNRDTDNFIFYDMFKTATGRLTIHPKTFPILNLDQDLKKAVYPTNDLFIEFDYNSAEIRVLNSLCSIDVGEDDIHWWAAKNIFNNEDRELTKRLFFAWLYNPEKKNEQLDKFYKRDEILEKYHKNGIIITPFKRELKADSYHALNYLLQSTSSDLTIDSAVKIRKRLKNTKSFVAFMVHDSIVIDASMEDVELIKELYQTIYLKTELGDMVATLSAGDCYGNLRVIQ